MKINYEEILDYQKFWKESESLTDKQKEGYMILSNKLIERALRNDGEIDNIILYYPEDYADSRIFIEFASAMGASVCIRKRKKGGLEMKNFGLNHEVDVE